MTLTTPPVLTSGPNRTQLPYGLFSVLSASSGPDRWEGGGVTWVGLSCEPAQALPLNCDPEEALDFDGARPAVGEATPFTVNGLFECGPIPFSPEEARARAEAHLIAREQSAVEEAFWTGDQENYPNLTLASPSEEGDPIYDAPEDLGVGTGSEVLAALENFIAENYGSVGVLHMPRGLALRMLGLDLLHTRQGRLYTGLDTPVVAGAGYGDGSEVRATPALIGFRSEIYSFTEGGGGFDTRTNDLTGHAGRSYVIGFDPCGTAVMTVGTEE